MVSVAQAREVALSLPGAFEQDHHGSPSFRVSGKIFSTLRDPGSMNAMLDVDGIHTAVQGMPEVCSEVWWGKNLRAVQIDLSRATPEIVLDLLTDAWERKAPKRLLAERSAQAGSAG